MKRTCLKRLACLLCGASLLLSAVGCSRGNHAEETLLNDTEPAPAPTQSAEAAAPETTVPEITVPVTEALYIPEIHPDIVGLYIPVGDGTANRQLVTEFRAPRAAKTDIDCFEVIASRYTLLEGSSFTSIWKDAWNRHENTENAKIGFHIEFPLENGETVSKTMLKPSDSAEFFEYLEIYMYDDINQAGGWYTHLDDDDMNEDTIISSIKLHCGDRIDEVGDITLTAFIYDGDDCFDAQDSYIGFVLHTITITE